MERNLKMEINDVPVIGSQNISENLSSGLFPAADKFFFTSPSADILVQRVYLTKFVLWKYDFIVHQQTKLLFEQPIDKTFLFMNIGEDIIFKFRSQAPDLIGKGQFNIFHTPDFQMTAYPTPSKKAYELMLIDIADEQPENLIARLTKVAKMTGRFN